MPGWVHSQLRSLRQAVQRLRAQGHGLATAVLIRLPYLVARRGYRKAAQWAGGRVLVPWLDLPRFRRFQRSLSGSTGKRLFLIVMPGTLHFLLPCLHLLPAGLDVILLHNGCARWERDLLRAVNPGVRTFRLTTLPSSSIAHGDVLTLLLQAGDRDFGIIDHDMYLFDASVFKRLDFANGQCVLGLFGATSQATGLVYPLTHFLFFRISVWRALIERHQVTARLYRRAPARLRDRLAALGLGEGVFLKDYHDFFDTLHLLLALAYSEGLGVGFVALTNPQDAVHVGGTSSGLQQTKALGMVYANARFLELGLNAALRKPYRRLMGRFHSSAEIRPKLPRTPETLRMLVVLDRLTTRLEAASRVSA
jgi:hypothetical protein